MVTIAIIAVILLIAVPSVMKISASMKQRAYAAKRESIISAAELYAARNKDAFGNATQIQIKVRTLIYSGDVDIDVKEISEGCNEEIGCVVNPVDNTSINDELIAITRIKSITQAKFGAIEIKENEYIAKFDANGASPLKFLEASCTANEGGTCVITLPTITRTNGEVIGWNTDANAHDRLVGAEGDIIISEYDNGTTYYAITSKGISATFIANGADSIGEANSCTIYNTGTTCKVTAPTITRTGGTVIGWNTDANAHKESVSAEGDITISEDETYYAITSKGISATFDKNGADSIGEANPCTIYNTDTTCKVTAPTITTTTIYQARGWAEDASATDAIYAVGARVDANVNGSTYYAIQRRLYKCYKCIPSYTCKKREESVCSYSDGNAAVSACSSAGKTGCESFGCESSMWGYIYKFWINYTDGKSYYCYLKARGAKHWGQDGCWDSSKLKELLTPGKDGIASWQDSEGTNGFKSEQYCNSVSSDQKRTMYWNEENPNSNNIQLSKAVPIADCYPADNQVWAIDGYVTSYGYTYDNYVVNTTGCTGEYTLYSQSSSKSYYSDTPTINTTCASGYTLEPVGTSATCN